MANFKEYNLKEETNQFIDLNYFNEPTMIQQKVIPLALKDKDVIGISQTGTGKTHAFLIPILNVVNTQRDCVQAIITAPTRELALQIYTKALDMQKVKKGLRIKLITGGIEKSKMSGQLKTQPHIVIGTPGRMKDLFLDEQTLRLDSARILVIDEADMTMEYGFLEDIDMICSRIRKLQMMSFSATVPEQLRLFLKKYMVQPEVVDIKEDARFKPRIEHVLVPCKHFSYEDQLMHLLPTFDPYLCLIFANTKVLCAEIANRLRSEGYGVIEIHGDLENRERKSAMKSLTTLKERYIVASDVASRGIDIDGVSHVISLGFPKELDFYVHRSGRTGRAGKEGICFALYKDSDEASIRQLQNKGIHFEHKKISGDHLETMNPIFYKRKRKDDPLDKEVSKIVNNKKAKIKPGYKKKRAIQIESLKRKAKRSMVQTEIKKQAKEKAKARQIAKREGSGE